MADRDLESLLFHQGWKKLEQYWQFRRSALLERLSSAPLREVRTIQVKVACIDEFLRAPEILKDREFPFSVPQKREDREVHLLRRFVFPFFRKLFNFIY